MKIKSVEMNELRKKENVNIGSNKLNWEAPKLISLDKGKTEGGNSFTAPTEDFDYTKPAGS